MATRAGERTPQHINVNVINPDGIDTPDGRTVGGEGEICAGAERIPSYSSYQR